MPYTSLVPIAFENEMRPPTADLTVMAADVGGTKTNIALYHAGGDGLSIQKEKKYASADYHSLKDIIHDFSEGSLPDRVCASVAGPVWHGQSHLTNLNWELDSKVLGRSLGLLVCFINDLEATAYGLAGLEPSERVTLVPGDPGADGNLAIIAPGTGLGEGGLYWDGRRYHPFATEGGHSDFAPRTELDIDLLRWLQKQFGHVSWERVVSGIGIKGLFHFLTEARGEKIPDELARRMSNEDPAAVISEAALARANNVCMEVMDLFVRYLATEAASLVLKLKATGGLYLGGGIPPKILPLLQTPDWARHFDNEGRMHDLIGKVPVHVVLNDKMALLGAAYYGVFSM